MLIARIFGIVACMSVAGVFLMLAVCELAGPVKKQTPFYRPGTRQ
jgi:hypothetical protein